MQLRSGITALALSLALLLPGCGIIDDLLTGPGNPPHCEPEPFPFCGDVAPAHLVPLPLIDVMCDPYQLNGVAIEGDVLCAEATYGGGCKEHSFNLLVDDSILESNPPQVQVLLTHYANQDLCKALLTTKTGFDLTPLKEHLRRITGRKSGSVMLHVSGVNTQHSVLYHY